MAVKPAARWLYGALFVLVLPAGLVAWAASTGPIVPLPRLHSAPLGSALAAAGAAALLLGMLHLWTYGGGLPMNLCPPPRYVGRGIYRWLPHPIYTGFVLLCAGVSIAAGSASGLWMVSPLVALGCASLVLGYEKPDLAERFGPTPGRLLPEASDSPPSAHHRLACYLFVFLPWVALYLAVIAAGLPPDATSLQLPFEKRLPVVEWSEAFYASAYLVTAAAPLVARRRRHLRRFCARGLGAMAVAFPLYFAVPLAAFQRPFLPHTALGRLLAWERTLDNAAGAFPSFHVIWSLLAAQLLAQRWPRWAWCFYGWAALVAASCVSAGQHPIVDVAGGVATVALVSRAPRLWQAIRGTAERIANSWREWRLGPVRLINHGFYAGAGAFLACAIAETLAGPAGSPAVLLAAFTAVVGAALWAQWIEGSPQLLRPFGFYGGLLGGTLGALAAPLLGVSPWLVLAAFAAGGPWAQAFGRLRCLVQGCCHGCPAPEPLGIRYTHPRSRVCRMTGWTGVPLHPTPVYSILWNAVAALAIARCWSLHAPLHLLAGLYFILNGLGRFAEEAWRGEPQTPVLAGLRLYQWAAIGSVLAGVLMTALGSSPAAPALQFRWTALFPALAFGLLVTAAMGADFPDSHRPFSRLA